MSEATLSHAKPSRPPKASASVWGRLRTLRLSRKVIEPLFVLITLWAIVASVIVEHSAVPDRMVTVWAVIAYFTGGLFGLEATWHSLKEGQINIDFLMLLAAVGAATVGQWRDGAILLFLFSLSNVLQDYAIGRSRKAIRALFALYPEEARVRAEDGSVLTVPLSEIRVGQTVLLQPGERVPVDGEVIGGSSYVDESTITGEPMPVAKHVGDRVFAGTLNENGALDIRVTHLASQSTLARIIQMVEEAQSRKAPTQRFLDRFEQYYALGVIAVALLVMFVPWALLGWAFQTSFYRAMVLLVVASPCALVISVPAAFLSAIAAGARRGVIFKGGAHLEQMSTIRVVAFDKTGTLTEGKPRVTDVIPFNGYSVEDVLRIAGQVEARSEHPLSRAVCDAVKERGLPVENHVEDFSAVPGQGVTGVVDGVTVRVGRMRYIAECAGEPPAALMAEYERLHDEAKTVLFVSYGEKWLGLIAVADKLRPQAPSVVEALHRSGVQHVVMLTGDNRRVAEQIAAEAGIDHVYAELMPEDKAAIVPELEAQYGPVAMVGDGVNDAPALAAATVGIAMGAAGTDVALETADVVLMSDNIETLPYALRLSRRARRVVWQNIAFALAVIVLLVFSAFVFELPLPYGVVGHEGSTVLVVLNGLRLLGGRS